MDTPQPPALPGSFLTGYMRSPKLTDAQKQKIALALFQKMGSRNCEMCSQLTWAIGDNIVSPMPLMINHFSQNYSIDYTVVHASVHLICTNCGNTKLIHLSQLGFNPFAPEGS